MKRWLAGVALVCASGWAGADETPAPSPSVAGAGWAKAYGYPVHVVYSVNGRAEIDARYWLIRDASGHWQIPAICTVR
jgi:hypothetical protein